MVISTNCSLSPPISTPIQSPATRIAEIARAPKQRSWKNQCLLGLTCAIIGLESGNFPVIAGDREIAIATDIQTGSRINRVQRWSDKRACQPWRLNSLETIVPENLPRPSARRRWEATGFSETAPPVKVAAKSDAKSCFYL